VTTFDSATTFDGSLPTWDGGTQVGVCVPFWADGFWADGFWADGFWRECDNDLLKLLYFGKGLSRSSNRGMARGMN